MNKPRILLLDIETSPILGYVWRMYEDNVLKVVEPTKIICIGWKWLDEKVTHVLALPDFKGYKAGVLDDRKLVQELWDLLDAADVIIAHNGDSFDVKKSFSRFIANGRNAPSAFVTIDTCKVAKKYFRFDSNSLDNLGGLLGEGHKVNTGGFELWDKCMAGDSLAWELMKKYNKKDVDLLERIYLRLRPFIGNHPNLNVIADRDDLSCPSCLGHSLARRGFAITRTGRKQRYQCGDCGSWSSGPYQKAKIVLR